MTTITEMTEFVDLCDIVFSEVADEDTKSVDVALVEYLDGLSPAERTALAAQTRALTTMDEDVRQDILDEIEVAWDFEEGFLSDLADLIDLVLA